MSAKWTEGPEVFGLKTYIAPGHIKLLDVVMLTNGEDVYGWRPGLPSFVKLDRAALAKAGAT